MNHDFFLVQKTWKIEMLDGSLLKCFKVYGSLTPKSQFLFYYVLNFGSWNYWVSSWMFKLHCCTIALVLTVQAMHMIIFTPFMGQFFIYLSKRITLCTFRTAKNWEGKKGWQKIGFCWLAMIQNVRDKSDGKYGYI